MWVEKRLGSIVKTVEDVMDEDEDEDVIDGTRHDINVTSTSHNRVMAC